MDEATITVRCACGWETTGPEDAIVEATVEHGRRMHNMVPTRDQVLAMAVPPPEAHGGPSPAKPIRFTARIRYWDATKGSGLAVVDIPSEHVRALGGLKQQRARGSLSGAGYTSSVMPAGGGRLALSVSKAMMAASHLTVGD